MRWISAGQPNLKGRWFVPNPGLQAIFPNVDLRRCVSRKTSRSSQHDRFCSAIPVLTSAEPLVLHGYDHSVQGLHQGLTAVLPTDHEPKRSWGKAPSYPAVTPVPASNDNLIRPTGYALFPSPNKPLDPGRSCTLESARTLDNWSVPAFVMISINSISRSQA